MVWMGRKAQLLARSGMDIPDGNPPSRRRALIPVFTRVANTSPNPRTPQRVDILIPTAVLHVMQAVLNTPVLAEHSKRFLWSAPLGTQAGQQVPALPAHLPSGYIHPLLLHHGPLPRPRKPQLIPDVAGQQVIGPDPPPLDHARFFWIVPGFYPTVCSGPQTPGTICHHFTQRRRTGYLPDTNSTKG